MPSNYIEELTAWNVADRPQTLFGRRLVRAHPKRVCYTRIQNSLIFVASFVASFVETFALEPLETDKISTGIGLRLRATITADDLPAKLRLLAQASIALRAGGEGFLVIRNRRPLSSAGFGDTTIHLVSIPLRAVRRAVI